MTRVLLLSLCGGALGIFVCFFCVKWIHVLGTKSIPRLQDVGMMNVCSFLLAAVRSPQEFCSGLAPALRVSSGFDST